MTKRSDEGDWRRHVVEQMLPRMEANTGPATGFQQATAADFGPITFRGDRAPNDPTALLDGLPLVKWAAIKQRAFDLHASIPSFEAIREVQLEKISHANRISELVKARGDGGPNLPESAPQVATVRKQMQRAEQELARLQALREIRTAKWNSAGSLARSISDWLLHGGIPHGCMLEPVADPPLSELLKKGETIANAIERFRHRRREQLADLHRVRSSPWPSSVAKAAARELIDRFADAGQPNLDGAIEFGQPISFTQTAIRSTVRNVDATAIAHAEITDVLGLFFGSSQMKFLKGFPPGSMRLPMTSRH
jgi:hypothetical protein